MKEMKKFLYVLFPLLALAAIFGFFIEIKADLTILFCLLLIAAMIIFKEKIGKKIVIALLFAMVDTSYYVYHYTSNNIMLGNFNLFPLVSWTGGLVLLKEINDRLKIKFKFLIMCLGYWAFLFLLEYIGYYLLGIQLTGNNQSLFGMGIIHTPLDTKFFYVLAGPIYLLIADYLKIK